jgi:hypothetical protein
MVDSPSSFFRGHLKLSGHGTPKAGRGLYAARNCHYFNKNIGKKQQKCKTGRLPYKTGLETRE